MKRVAALDALRGFAIITMVLSGVIPYGVLPDWMYHAQLPPPKHGFNPELPGLTWVDLVFPMFIFALGCAIPFAIGKRLQQAESRWAVIGYIAQRAFLLAFFAIFLQHVRPHQIGNPPDSSAWLIALGGFLILFLIMVNLPAKTKPWQRRAIRIVGWGGALLALATVTHRDGTTFLLQRSDIIILVLANVYFFSALMWLATRDNFLQRAAFLLFFLALRLSHEHSEWTQTLWNISPVPWLFRVDFLKYLFIAIPGTMVGDRIIRFLKTRNSGIPAGEATRYWLSAVICLAIIVVNLVGLQSRMVPQTLLGSLALLGGFWAIHRRESPFGGLIWDFFLLAAVLLITGLLLEPFEGGIKKDPSTLSYYAVTTAISVLALQIFIIVLDGFGKQKAFEILTANGQNPMIAYVGMANLIWPLTHLSGVQPWIEAMTTDPWAGFARGLFFTCILAVIVWQFTKNRLIWRA